MKNLIAFVALAGLAGTSLGQTFVSAGPTAQNSGGYGDRSTYQMDDGISDNSFGLTQGGYLGVANSFAITGGNNVITSVETTWGTPLFAGNGVVPGSVFDIFIWADLVPGAGPQPGSLLFAGSSTIAAGSIDTDIFQSVAVPNIVVPGAGFIVAVAQNHAAGTYPFSVDANGPGLNRSWFIGAAGFDPNAAPGFGGGPGFEMYGFAGINGMVRANAIPAPGALALLGLGGLIVGRRRR